MANLRMTKDEALHYFFSLGESDIPSGSEASFCSDEDGEDCGERQDCSGIFNSDYEAAHIPTSNNLVSNTKAAVPPAPPTADHVRERTVWHAGRDNAFSSNVPPPAFTGSHSVNVQGNVPYDFLKSFFPDDLIDRIVFETNQYAFQCGKINFKVTKKEIQTFLGINIIMTYIHYPSVRMYWSSIQGMRFDLICNAMSLNRFEEIKRFLHFVNNESKPTDEASDRFWKLTPVITALHNSFHAGQSPEENLAIDEMIIPFKGRSRMKQYIRGKPKRWGFKVWVRASSSGYIQCFEFYSGKDKNSRSTLGPVGDTVMRLCHDIKGKNHKLFIDNLFTSLPLIRKLRSDDILVLGTLRINRAPGVAEKLVPGKLLQRGSSTVATSDDNITVVIWMDNKEVHTISSFAGAQPESEVHRWDRKAKAILEIPRPFSIGEYNRHMGGVDLADRMIAHYPHGFKSKKWYLRVFFHLLNMALVNAWISYKEAKNEKIPFVTFKASVAHTLIALGTTEVRKRGRPSCLEEAVLSKKKTVPLTVTPQVRFDGYEHWPKKAEGREMRCRNDTCKKRTRYICSKCQVAVCPDCMQSFHTQ
ncbi:piggyBac transposable element-derived protein 3-like [Bacillus rossius redtenbacheri]|uniref:piggyBac transposable element-derived protein 3-like n=1 Tax=Bacillus rossius redtenbacheri TaxID=93214 RepID=UPI002FDD11DF